MGNLREGMGSDWETSVRLSGGCRIRGMLPSSRTGARWLLLLGCRRARALPADVR
jgi:hypothetical protein